jgi:acetylornithine deacetylase/succinyl-diaminopimelate desuccinylase-like protein
MQPVSAAERARFEAQSAREDAIAMAAAGLSSLPGEAGYSAVERATARPTFEVHGIRGGFVGEGAKTVIPATATAKVSLRLVAGQNPDAVLELVRRQVAELAVEGVRLEVRPLHGGNGVTFAVDSPALQLAAQVLEEEFGNPTEFTRTGGSIPIAALFHSFLNMQGVLMGFGLPDDNVHAPNEKFHIPHYYAAIRSVANFLQRMGA